VVLNGGFSTWEYLTERLGFNYSAWKKKNECHPREIERYFAGTRGESVHRNIFHAGFSTKWVKLDFLRSFFVPFFPK